MASYTPGDIDASFATTYRLPTPKHAPFTIGYTLEDKSHHYLPDAVGTFTNGKLFIAEAGMEDDKQQDRNLAKAEAARRRARIQRGTYWIGTEKTLTKQRHYNLVFLERKQTSIAKEAGIPRSTLGRLVRRTRQFGQMACVPGGTYARSVAMHPAFAARWRGP